MAAIDLTTYAGLQDAVAQFLGQRTDIGGQIPAFIALAEAEIGRRYRRKTITKTISVAQTVTALPVDCAELRSAHIISSSKSLDRPLRVVTPEVLAETRSSYAAAGRPVSCSLLAGNLIVAPDPDQAYTVELQYFEKLVPLSSNAPTNSTLLEAPDLYLYGALLHAAPYLEHDERIPVWESRVERALAQIEIMREREETNASLRPARLPRRLG